MHDNLTRRNLFRLASAGALGVVGGVPLAAQQPPEPILPLPLPPLAPSGRRRSTVSLVKGENRRKMVYEALMGIDAELRPAVNRKKYVLIKPNLTSVTIQLASTHADTIRGILDYLAPRFKGPVVIAESSAGETMQGFENFKYDRVVAENRS